MFEFYRDWATKKIVGAGNESESGNGIFKEADTRAGVYLIYHRLPSPRRERLCEMRVWAPDTGETTL